MLQVSGVTTQTTQPTGVNGVKKLNFTVVIIRNSSLVKGWYSLTYSAVLLEESYGLIIFIILNVM